MREASVVFEAPPGTAVLDPASLRLLEDGEARTVVKVEALIDHVAATRGPTKGGGPKGSANPATGVPGTPAAAATDPPWELLLYIDRAVTSPDLVRRSSLVLAQFADALTALGTVQVVVADPQPRQLLAPSRNALEVSTTLYALAGEARRAAELPFAVRRDGFQLRHQLDGCIHFTATPAAGAPRALLLVIDPSAPMPPPIDPFGEMGALLASYGWIVAPLLPWPTRDVDPLQRAAERASQAFNPQLVPLQELAIETAGFVVRDARQLSLSLASLRGRRRLWYQSTIPRDGHLHRLSLSLSGFRLRAPSWVRSSTPSQLSDSRLRLLLADGYVPDAPLDLRSVLSAGALQVLSPRPREPGAAGADGGIGAKGTAGTDASEANAPARGGSTSAASGGTRSAASGGFNGPATGSSSGAPGADARSEAGGASYGGSGAMAQGAGAVSQGAGALSQAAGATSQSAGAPSQAAGSPSQAAGAPFQAAGAPFQAAGAPFQAAGATSQSAGAPSQAAGAMAQGAGVSGGARAQAGPAPVADLAAEMRSSGRPRRYFAPMPRRSAQAGADPAAPVVWRVTVALTPSPVSDRTAAAPPLAPGPRPAAGKGAKPDGAVAAADTAVDADAGPLPPPATQPLAVRRLRCVAVPLAADWRCALALTLIAPPAGAERAAVIADDLEEETWGVTEIALAATPAALPASSIPIP